MTTRRTLLILLLSLACAAAARAGEGGIASDPEDTVWRYTNLSPDGRERLLLDEQRAAAARRANQRQVFNNQELIAIITRAALHHGLEPELLCALGWIESRFQPYAVSPMGAQGLMQLMPGTARSVGVSNLMNPVESAEGAARHLRSLLDIYDNDLTLALAAYNAGAGAVRRGRPLAPNAPTIGFVQAVLSARDLFRNQ